MHLDQWPCAYMYMYVNVQVHVMTCSIGRVTGFVLRSDRSGQCLTFLCSEWVLFESMFSSGSPKISTYSSYVHVHCITEPRVYACSLIPRELVWVSYFYQPGTRSTPGWPYSYFAICLSVFLSVCAFVRLSQPTMHAQLHHYHGHRNMGGASNGN